MENVIDFNQKPKQIVAYNFGDTVTRENFIHFLILSYALSKGSFIIQRVFFLMMKEKVGFPYESVIENFFNNGSFNGALSEEERSIFMQAFRGVKKHFEKYEEIEIDDEVRDEVDGLYDRPKDSGEVALAAALSFFDFKQIKSIPDFMRIVSEFNERFERSLN